MTGAAPSPWRGPPWKGTGGARNAAIAPSFGAGSLGTSIAGFFNPCYRKWLPE